MSDDRTRIVFNRYAPPGAGEPGVIHAYGDAPVVQLTPIPGAARPRRAPLPDGVATPGLLGDALGWAMRGYIVHALGASGADAGIPEQPATLEDRRRALDGVAPLPEGAPGGRPLCLFNVVVALEWTPSPRAMRQIVWAFRRASELLYDVTDGLMAFGQVVFGGRELMGCADFQVMASNRLHPRSYTNGLHDPKKYVPIRIGRGIWQKDLSLTTSWEEPEGYRILVHEWGHYALSLKDEYLGLERVARDRRDRTLLRRAGRALRRSYGARGFHSLGAAERRPKVAGDEAVLVLPGISLPVESIMSRVSSSELMAQAETSGRQRKANEWAKLAEKAEFAFLGIQRGHEPDPAPGWLPLPLPEARYWGGFDQKVAAGAEMRLPLPAGRIRSDHCWVYVVKGELDAPTQLVAQGTAEARSDADGFALLGAAPEDSVLLIGLAPARGGAESEPVVLRARVSDALGGDEAAWAVATPGTFPFVDVIPVLGPGAADLFAPKQMRVAVSPSEPGARYRDVRAWLFPLGGEGAVALGEGPVAAPALDGHVLVSIDGGRGLTVSTYSQGGGPGATPPVHANPTTAGSSEGNVMLFFYDEEFGPAFGRGAKRYEELGTIGGDWSDLSVVTTLNHGIAAPPGAKPRSYSFSLAATRALPALDPTLVLFCDKESGAEGEPRVYRHGQRGWEAVASYAPEGLPYVAAPLDRESAARLMADGGVERYRLCYR